MSKFRYQIDIRASERFGDASIREVAHAIASRLHEKGRQAGIEWWQAQWVDPEATPSPMPSTEPPPSRVVPAAIDKDASLDDHVEYARAFYGALMGDQAPSVTSILEGWAARVAIATSGKITIEKTKGHSLYRLKDAIASPPRESHHATFDDALAHALPSIALDYFHHARGPASKGFACHNPTVTINP